MTLVLTYDYPAPGKGPHLQTRYIAGLCFEAGWKYADKLLIAVAVCLAEGNGYVEAVHVNDDAVLDADGNVITPASTDYGLWQINDRYHPDVTQAQAFDPVFATAYAYQMYKKKSYTFTPWYAYTNGAWKGDRALGYAYDGVANYLRMKHNAYNG